MCFVDDCGGYSTIWKEQIRRAAKQHRCYDCNTGVAKGEQHWHVKSLYEGEWSEWRICNRCFQVRARIAEREFHEGCKQHESWPLFNYPLSELLAEMYEHDYDLSRPAECVDLVALQKRVNVLWVVMT